MRKACILLVFFFSCLSILFFGCSTTQNSVKQIPSATAENGFKDPLIYEMEFVIRINNIKFFGLDSLQKWNAANNIPGNEPPTLKIWCSDIIDMPNQRIIFNKEPEFKPAEIFTDNENGNRISYWDLSKKILDTQEIVIKRHFKYVTYDYSPLFDEKNIPDNYTNEPDDLYFFYTKSEPWLEQTPEIISLANSITENAKGIPAKTRAIFNWVRSKMTYKYPPEKRGVLEVMKKYEGDCGQYSALFITLCRAAGIPARQQSGLVIENKKIGYHVWSEAYFPSIGWIPMDCTYPDGYGHLDNKRLVSSLGLNIPLKHVPSWSNYDTQDAQGNRTDFMQFMTVVKSGFSASISTEKKVIGVNNQK